MTATATRQAARILDPNRRIRCGWCIAGHHHLCRMVLLFGVRERNTKSSHPYTWRCQCLCGYAQKKICAKCRRSGVELSNDLCVDSEDCNSYPFEHAVTPLPEED